MAQKLKGATAWGQASTARLLAGGKGFTLKEESIVPGDFEPWHFHKKTHQLFHCTKGRLEVRSPSENFILKRGEVLLIRAYQPHMLCNTGKSACDFSLYSTGNAGSDRYELSFPYPPGSLDLRSELRVLGINRLGRKVEIEIPQSLSISSEELEATVEELFIKHFFRHIFFNKRVLEVDWQGQQLLKPGRGGNFLLSGKQWITKHTQLKISTFTSPLAKEFTRLNQAWIERYFIMESEDRKSLNSPEEKIIRPGGEIFFCTFRAKVLATGALFWNENRELELTKMATEPTFQGMGLGKLIIDAAVTWASSKGVDQIVLYTQSSLFPALKLYEQVGFKYVELKNAHYDRADTKMILQL